MNLGSKGTDLIYERYKFLANGNITSLKNDEKNETTLTDKKRHCTATTSASPNFLNTT